MRTGCLLDAGAGVVAGAAVVLVLHQVHASHVTAMLGIALTHAFSAFEEGPGLGFAECIRRGAIVHHAIAILVDVIAALVSAGMKILIAIIAVRTAADRRRIAVMILVEDIEQADRGCRITADVGLASITLESLLTIRVVGACRSSDAALVDRAVLPTGTRCRARTRTNRMAALAHRVTGVDRAIEAVVAVGGAGRAGISGRTAASSCSSGSRVRPTIPSTGGRGVAAPAAEHACRRDRNTRK